MCFFVWEKELLSSLYHWCLSTVKKKCAYYFMLVSECSFYGYLYHSGRHKKMDITHYPNVENRTLAFALTSGALTSRLPLFQTLTYMTTQDIHIHQLILILLIFSFQYKEIFAIISIFVTKRLENEPITIYYHYEKTVVLAPGVQHYPSIWR